MGFLTTAILILMLVGGVIILWAYLSGKKKAEVVDEVIANIQAFTSLKNFKYEREFQINLAAHLKCSFKNLEMEELIGGSRPDITINKNIAIEIKGDTAMADLKSLPDKCMRYPEHFKCLIIVLFDIKIEAKELEDYLSLLKKHFPDVYVVVK